MRACAHVCRAAVSPSINFQSLALLQTGTAGDLSSTSLLSLILLLHSPSSFPILGYSMCLLTTQ